MRPGRIGAPVDDEAELARRPCPEPTCLVWIEAEEAVVARWDGQAHLTRVSSDVPARHRSTGHLRHDPRLHPGGGGPPTDRIERDRLEHLREYLERVAAIVPPDESVHVTGPGPVRDELARLLRAADRHAGRDRCVETSASAPLTDRQLVARLRALAGDAPRRRIVGRR